MGVLHMPGYWDALIELQRVSFAYRGSEYQVLEDISIQAAPGELITVIGPNGSGKSTLARLIAGLLTPKSGKTFIDGMDAASVEHKQQIRSLVGLCLQNPDHQLVASVVEEDVAFGPENLMLPSDEIRCRVDDALKAVNLTHLRMRAPHMLSGGEKQRLAIAGLLALAPKALVLDEPTSMLDPKGRKEVLTVLRRLADSGKLVILITHHMDEAAQGDRVWVLAKGKIVLDDKPDMVFNCFELLQDLGLTSTDAGNLSRRLLELGFAQKASNSTGIPGMVSTPGIINIEDMVGYLCQVLK